MRLLPPTPVATLRGSPANWQKWGKHELRGILDKTPRYRSAGRHRCGQPGGNLGERSGEASGHNFRVRGQLAGHACVLQITPVPEQWGGDLRQRPKWPPTVAEPDPIYFQQRK